MTKRIPGLLAIGLLAGPWAAHAADSSAEVGPGSAAARAPTDAVAASAAAAPATSPVAGVRKASPQVVARMQAMRDAYNARVAVYDNVEQAFRAPTAEERVALAASAPAPATMEALSLSNGGSALRAAGGELSFLVVEVQSDGTLSMRHAAPATGSHTAVSAPVDGSVPDEASVTRRQEVHHAH